MIFWELYSQSGKSSLSCQAYFTAFEINPQKVWLSQDCNPIDQFGGIELFWLGVLVALLSACPRSQQPQVPHYKSKCWQPKVPSNQPKFRPAESTWIFKSPSLNLIIQNSFRNLEYAIFSTYGSISSSHKLCLWPKVKNLYPATNVTQCQLGWPHSSTTLHKISDRSQLDGSCSFHYYFVNSNISKIVV